MCQWAQISSPWILVLPRQVLTRLLVDLLRELQVTINHSFPQLPQRLATGSKKLKLIKNHGKQLLCPTESVTAREMLTNQNAAKSANRCIQKQKDGKNGTMAKTAIVIHILMTLMQANMKRRMEITALGTAIQSVSSTYNPFLAKIF